MYKPLEAGYVPLDLRIAAANAALEYANALADPCMYCDDIDAYHAKLIQACEAVAKILTGRD